MQLRFITTAISFFCLASCVSPVISMRFVSPEGWQFPWAGDFKDKRLHFRDVAIVYAWPSSGGRLELQSPSAFELDFLGIEDHLAERNKSADAIEEDAFVARLRRLGGIFYEHQYGFRRGEHLSNETHTWLGWPEDEEHKGGVWVLKVKWIDRREKMTGRIRLATTMQDRCRAIEMSGGVFYASPTEDHLVPMEPTPRWNHRDQERRLEAKERAIRMQDQLSFQS